MRALGAIARTCDRPDCRELRAMSPTDDRELVAQRILAGAFALMALLVALDLLFDVRAGTTALHVVLEGSVIAIGFSAAASLALRVRRLARDARELRVHATHLAASLLASQQEADRWRTDAQRWRTETSHLIDGLSAAIDQQFTRWDLSPAEREVALLLLKGLSHREIATVRDVNETTVRQQARGVYKKAGLSGRNDLAAFFLEDLLGPRDRRPVA